MSTIRNRILCISIVILTFAVLVGTYISSGLSTQYEIEPGSICPEDIYATRNIVDNVTTQERKAAARAGVKDVYTTDYGKVDTAVSLVNTNISVIRDMRDALKLISDDSSDTAFDNHTYLSESLYKKALSLPDSDFDILAEHTPTIVQRVMTSGVTNLANGLESFVSSFRVLNVSNPAVEEIAAALCKGALSVNKQFNSQETDNQREIAANAVANVTYMKNQVIARRGEIVTEAQYSMLRELGFVKGSIQIDLFHTVSVILLLLITLCLVVFHYITEGRKTLCANSVSVTVISSVLTCLGALMLLFTVKSGGSTLYLMPLALIPALGALLLNANHAVMINLITAVTAGVLTGDLSVTLAIFLAGSASAYVFAGVKRRAHLLSATALSALFYAIAYSSTFIDTSKSIIDVLIIFTCSFIGGIFGGVLTTGTIPFWEAVFDVITPMKLGELSNPEHKLLKKLLFHAPGSYHHSLTVANMADSAANAINANGPLARVGAYYHDIGKIENPLFFKENQFGIDNPHDSLSPSESARIIINHVSDGVRLANQYHLPKAVVDIISQHHGTTTVSYFLYKARQQNADTNEADFTYPGSVPSTKEATIIMLADACEAAVRAMREKGDADVTDIVDSIISSRISEGQLSGSNLTFSDLEKVKESFVKTLEQYFHKRIIYPQNKEKD